MDDTAPKEPAKEMTEEEKMAAEWAATAEGGEGAAAAGGEARVFVKTKLIVCSDLTATSPAGRKIPALWR